MSSLSFPFRVDPVTRGVVTNPSGSDPEVNEAIAVHLLTEVGERPLRPSFGTVSPEFGGGIDAGALQLQLQEHGWAHVEVRSVVPGPVENNRVQTVVNWERRGS